MTRRVAILNFKGGVGKSTIAVNLSHALALRGARVLLVDCDLQANASSFVPGAKDTAPTLTQVMTGQAPIGAAIRQARPGLDLLPADKNLNTANAWIVSQGRRAYTQFSAAIGGLSGYDVILFDMAPSYSTVAEAVLLATEELLVPAEMAPFAVEGLLNMLSKLEEDMLDHNLIIRAIVPSKLDARYNMTGDYLKQIQGVFKERVTPAIRTDSALTRAQAHHMTIFEYAPESKAAQDFNALASHMFAEIKAGAHV